MASVFNGGVNLKYSAKVEQQVWRQWIRYANNTTTASYAIPDYWLGWNQTTYQATTANNLTFNDNVFYVNGANAGTGSSEWVFDTTVGNYNSYKIVAWDKWNDHYEETREQKIARQVHEFVQWARYGARYPGRAQIGHGPIANLDELLAEVRTKIDVDLTPEQWREIEDGWQRGSEERIEDERQAELARMEREERERLQAEADRRAELLLLSLLTHDQKEEWLANRHVTEVAPSGRVWRLFPKWSGAACLMDGAVRRATLCLHPLERVPDVDVMAAILVGLRSGEEEHYIKIAVLHHGTWTREEEELRRGFKTQRVEQPEGYVVVPAVA